MDPKNKKGKEKYTHTHKKEKYTKNIKIKFLKTSNKEEILKHTEEKGHVMYRKAKIKTEVSHQKQYKLEEWKNIFELLKFLFEVQNNSQTPLT